MNTPPIREIAERAQRALDVQPVVRIAAVVLWSGFLGAIGLLLGWLILTPPTHADLAQLSRFFLVAWALALIPALCAAVLTHYRHGH